LSLKAVNSNIFTNYNRFYIYRLFKKLGFTQKFGDNVNFSVTHFFRKSAALEALSMNNDLQDITSILGHKSAKSAHYYNKK
jgi:site-specific recombinase XerC